MASRPALRPKVIENEASNVLSRAELTEWPVDLEAVAAVLGVEVEFVDFEDDLSGVLLREGDDDAIIAVNLQHHPNRRRFTLAHEIGHLVLHGGTYVDRGTSVKFRDSRSGSGTIRDEREANRFAAALLMPGSWVKRAVEHTKLDPATDAGLQELADSFGVSSLAMSYRLANLGLLDL